MYQLRELSRNDLPTITTWRNSPELIAQLGAPFRYINSEVDQKWFDSYMAHRDTCLRCSIVDETQPHMILGLISLTNIDHLNRSAVLHIMIGDPSAQGKGIGTFAVTQMLSHAFENMNLHRISLTVLASNKRAQHLYEKCGFVQEGVLRKALYKSGNYVDVLQYAILREDTQH